MPEVTVIIPTVRIDPWLDDAVNSALNSNFQDFEVLVCCDGFVPEEFPIWSKDSRVRLLCFDERQGLPRILNKAIKETNSELIARLDADDLMDPERIAAQVKLMNSDSNLVVIGTSISIIDEESNQIGFKKLPTENVAEKLLQENVLAHPSVMFRKAAVIKVGGYCESMKQMEDYDLWLRLARVGDVSNIDELLTSYRVHTTQMSSSTRLFSSYVLQISRSRKQLGDYLKVRNVTLVAYEVRWLIGQLIFSIKSKFGFSNPRGIY